MTQERMHHEDARREMAMRVWDYCSTDMEVGHAVQWAVSIADAILAELARTAKPEEPKKADKYEADLKTARENLKKADDRWANEKEVSARHLAKTIILDARVKELEEAIRFHESRRIGGPSRADMELWNMVN